MKTAVEENDPGPRKTTTQRDSAYYINPGNSEAVHIKTGDTKGRHLYQLCLKAEANYNGTRKQLK